jgi:arylesterase/paraoxonase
MRLHPWGCKFAIKNLHGKIGIVQAPNGTLYVANTGLTMQAGKSLVITDYVKTGMKRIKISLILLQDRGMDNLLVDLAGHVWAAGKHFEVNALSNALNPSPSSANALIIAFQHFSIPCPSNAHCGLVRLRPLLKHIKLSCFVLS